MGAFPGPGGAETAQFFGRDCALGGRRNNRALTPFRNLLFYIYFLECEKSSGRSILAQYLCERRVEPIRPTSAPNKQR